MTIRVDEKWLLDYQQRQKSHRSQVDETLCAELDAAMKEKPKSDKRGKANKTETEYGNRLSFEFPGCAIRYEAISLKLDNSHVYTADWCVSLPNGQILLVEVKNGAYRHASYGRSKMAFDQARIDWPMFQFRWAEKFKEGWNEK